MPQAASSPGEIDGHGLAILLLLNFHCRVRLPDTAREARRALLLLLMDLIYQVVAPTASLQHFLVHVRAALLCDPQQAEVVCEYLHRTLEILQVSDGLTKLFNEKLSRILTPYESMGLMETSDVFVDRRSFFGLHFRRVKLVFDSLDLEARGRLRDVALAWKEGSLDSASQSDAYGGSDETEDQSSRIVAYERFQVAILTGDFAAAKDNMQKSFDYFAPGSDRELHQHTLLHLATFHYQTGGLTAARAALDEAISLARSADDHECIVMCESLMRRLQGEGTSRGTVHAQDPESLQLSSQDTLWQAERDAATGDDLVAVLHHLTRSFRPPRIDTKAPRSSVEMSLHLMEDATRRFGANAARPYITMGSLWQELGHAKIANVYLGRAARPNGAVASIQAEAHIQARCRKALKCARRGNYDSGLGLLLRPRTFEALSIGEYHAWAEAVWSILWLRAKRRRETKTLQRLAKLDPSSHHVLQDADIEDLVETPKALQELLVPSGMDKDSTGPQQATETRFGRRTTLTFGQKIELLLDKAQRLVDADQATRAQSPALLAIALARAKGHASLERAGITILARIAGIGFGMPEQATAALDEVLPHILADDDLETRATAQWTYAECMLATARPTRARDGSDSLDMRAIRDSVTWLDRAERDMERISLIHVQRKVLYHQARVLHELDRAEERDGAIAKLAEVERDCLGASEAECTESLQMVDKVLEVVKMVGEHVSCGAAATIRLNGGT